MSDSNLEVVGMALGAPLLFDFESALSCVSAGDIGELKACARCPPESIKDTVLAMLTLLGEADATWEGAVIYLRSASAENIASRLRGYDLNTVTPAMTRKLKPVMEKPRSAGISISKAAAALSAWVGAVYAFGAYNEALLTNYALFSPRLANVPYSKLTRYQSSKCEIGFCWRTGLSEAAPPVELA